MPSDTNSGKERNGKWILGALGAFLLSKGKAIFAFLKFGKFGGTILSMFISIWAYVLIYPLGFAIGFVLLLLVHELGHVIAAKQKGLPTSAPTFIPFIGALINLKRHPRDAQTEAYVAFGGPFWGTLGALIVFFVARGLQSDWLLHLAYVGFFLNLINLLPIHPLDGGRIVTAISRWFWIVGLIAGLFVVIWIKSILFFIIWAMFAFDLYKKYVKKKPSPTYLANMSAEVPVEWFEQNGLLIPQEQHRRILPFTTYSTLNGQQTIEVGWPGLGSIAKIPFDAQATIEAIALAEVRHIHPSDLAPAKLLLKIEIRYLPYQNDRYYEVPSSVRWMYGLGYIGLATALGYMMYYTQTLVR